jgi:hypothetical protein
MENEITNEKLTFEKVWQMFKETDLKFQETDLKFQETDRIVRENSNQLKETKELVRELSLNIGGLNNKFGSFNEALVAPSINRILSDTFNCYLISNNTKFKNNGNSFEIDVFGESSESIILVEIKSSLKDSAIEQLLVQIQKVRNSKKYPDKKIIGIIAATDYSEATAIKIAEIGLYFISVTESLVELKTPANFIPKSW